VECIAGLFWLSVRSLLALVVAFRFSFVVDFNTERPVLAEIWFEQVFAFFLNIFFYLFELFLDMPPVIGLSLSLSRARARPF
jgi:hypothetical protein